MGRKRFKDVKMCTLPMKIKQLKIVIRSASTKTIMKLKSFLLGSV